MCFAVSSAAMPPSQPIPGAPTNGLLPARGRRQTRLLRIGGGVLVSLVCLWLAMSSVPRDELLDSLADASCGWLLIAAGAQLAAVWARALRWQALLRGEARFSETFWAMAVGYLGTNIFPLRAGEAARVVLMSRRANLPIARVGATAVVERALDVSTVLVVLLALVFVIPVPDLFVYGGLTLGAALLVALGLIVGLVTQRERAEALVHSLTRLFPSRLGLMVRHRIPELVDGLEGLIRPAVLYPALGWSAVSWAFSIGTYWAVIQAIAPGGSVVEPAFAIAAISLGLSVPSSPGFVGIFQLVGQQALATPFPDRFTLSSALAIALLAHLVYYLLTTALGVVGLVRLGVSLGQVRASSHAAAGEQRG